jgi:uncharacterized membrane protein
MAEKVESAFKKEVSKARLEFLFDGVFAIAMTLLVLELRLPEIQDRRSVPELARALLANWRTFVSWLISFIVLSLFWILHNQIYSKITRITRTCLAIHIWLLAVAASFPFCAHMLGRYLSNPLANRIYYGAFLFFIFGVFMLVVAAERQKLFDPAIPVQDIHRLRRRFMRTLLVLTIAFIYYGFLRFWL